MKKIQQYLNNQLSEREDDQVTRVLLSNYYDSALQQRWEQQLSEKYGLDAPQKTKTKVRSLPKRLVAVAATFLLFLSAYQLNNYFQKTTPNELVAMHLSNKEPHTNNRKSLESMDVEDARNAAINTYVQEDHKSSIDYYNIVLSSNDNTIDDYYYQGLNYLYSEQPEAAIKTLKEALKKPILPTDKTRSYETIHWYLGLAYLKVEDTASAIIELKTIKVDKKELVEELLEALEFDKNSK